MQRLAFLFLALLTLAVPASALRHRRYVRHRTAPRRVVRPAPAPSIEPVRNVILMAAHGYDAGDWDAARTARPDGLLAWDRMPVSFAALSGDKEKLDPAGAARLLATGTRDASDAAKPTLLSLAKRAGRSVALVGAGSITDPMPASLAVPSTGRSPAETLQALLAGRYDALFARSAPTEGDSPPNAPGYTVATEPQAVLMAETTPVLGTARADAVPFDTLTFRALHLVAKNPRGFMMAVTATRSGARPEEFNAAVSTALSYVSREPHTLILVALFARDGAVSLFAAGMYARKFTGTLMLADVPKIIAGVAAIKGMGRDFSPLFRIHVATPAPPHGRGIVPLPW